MEKDKHASEEDQVDTEEQLCARQAGKEPSLEREEDSSTSSGSSSSSLESQDVFVGVKITPTMPDEESCRGVGEITIEPIISEGKLEEIFEPLQRQITSEEDGRLVTREACYGKDHLMAQEIVHTLLHEHDEMPPEKNNLQEGSPH